MEFSFPPPSVAAHQIANNPCFHADNIYSFPRLDIGFTAVSERLRHQRQAIVDRYETLKGSAIVTDRIAAGKSIPSVSRDEPVLLQFVLDTCVTDIKRIPRRAKVATNEEFDAISQCMQEVELYNGIAAKAIINREGVFDFVMREVLYGREMPDDNTWLALRAYAVHQGLPGRADTRALPGALVVGRGYQKNSKGTVFTTVSSASLIRPQSRINEEQRVRFTPKKVRRSSPFRF